MVPRARSTFWRSVLVLSAIAAPVAVAGVASLPSSSAAGWLTRAIKEAGDATGEGLDAGRIAIQRGAPRSVGKLADAVQSITKRDKRAAVLGATAVGPDEWTFVNASGEVFTAANANELARARTVLLPDADPRRATKLVMSETALFGESGDLMKAFPDAELAVAVGRRGQSYGLRATSTATVPGAPTWRLNIRSNVDVALTNRAELSAMLDVLERPIRRDKLTVLALRRQAPRPGSRSLSRGDTQGIAGLEVAEGAVPAALKALRGRTAVLTGRVSGDTLTYRTAAGFDREIAIGPIREAAAANDVTLLLVNSATPRQPGVRNWLWQRASIAGFEKALTESDLAGMVNALADGNGRMVATIKATGAYRTTVTIAPEPSALSIPGSDLLGDITATVISETTGNVATKAISLDATSAERQSELDWRFVPWIPSALQLGYLFSFIIGLIGLPFLRVWWPRVWPPEASGEYASWIGLALARFARALTFLLVFLPLAGLPAAVATVAYTLWNYLLLPFRMLSWLLGKARGQAT